MTVNDCHDDANDNGDHDDCAAVLMILRVRLGCPVRGGVGEGASAHVSLLIANNPMLETPCKVHILASV